MIKKIMKNVNLREYDLFLNGKEINIKTRRINGIRNQYYFLSSGELLTEEYSYFIYNEYNFASFGISENIDLLFVDWDGKIIHIEENFLTNKITKKINKTKFIYIFKRGIISRKKLSLNDVLTHQFKR